DRATPHLGRHCPTTARLVVHPPERPVQDGCLEPEAFPFPHQAGVGRRLGGLGRPLVTFSGQIHLDCYGRCLRQATVHSTRVGSRCVLARPATKGRRLVESPNTATSGTARPTRPQTQIR